MFIPGGFDKAYLNAVPYQNGHYVEETLHEETLFIVAKCFIESRNTSHN